MNEIEEKIYIVEGKKCLAMCDLTPCLHDMKLVWKVKMFDMTTDEIVKEIIISKQEMMEKTQGNKSFKVSEESIIKILDEKYRQK